MAKTVGRSKQSKSKRSKQSKRNKSRKNYMKKGGFIIDASKVHPASIILSK